MKGHHGNAMKTVCCVGNRPARTKILETVRLEGKGFAFTGNASHLFPPLMIQPPPKMPLTPTWNHTANPERVRASDVAGGEGSVRAH